MLSLSPAERRALRARAHHLQAVVTVGDAGLTPAVLNEIDVNLKNHELIKVKASGGDRRQRERLIAEICGNLEAGAVQHIGRVLVIYRPRPEDPAPARPQARSRKKTRRGTKRSYQHS
ncbi:MAG: YhbY family RNA-binding protein [Betaproteobacteria bacterium]|nr:YhbY family RNA-binding protein [Betaproteobacteria bacterium]